MDHAIPRHPRGGPFPHLQPGYHAELPRVIQHARGLVHSGTEPMEVGRFIAEQTHALALGMEDLRCALGYVLSAAISAGRLAAIRTRMEMGLSPVPTAADLLEVMEALGVVRCRDCGDVALPAHRCPDQGGASAPPQATHSPQSIALLRYVAARDPLAAAQMAAAREQERAPRAEAQPLSAAPPIPLDPAPAADNATGGCRPGGPYCPGMNAALDAAAKGGLAAGSLLKIGGAAEPPEVIIHRGVINGERRQLLLQCCPFCRAELEPRRTLVAAAPAAEGTLLASETALVPVVVDCCDLHRSFPSNPGSCLNRPPGEAPRAVIFGEVLLGRGPAIAQARAEALIAAQRASIAPQSPVAAPEGAALTEHGVDARLKQD